MKGEDHNKDGVWEGKPKSTQEGRARLSLEKTNA